MKRIYWILIVVILVILFFMIFRLGGEDSWIKDEKGEYVKHGVPSETPDYVKEQQEAISCALSLYNEKESEGMEFSSQCLGTCGDYVIDVVHVPRNEEDNEPENQCSDYRTGKAKYFIELDQEGNISRIV